jgi:hypothetical protein
MGILTLITIAAIMAFVVFRVSASNQLRNFSGMVFMISAIIVALVAGSSVFGTESPQQVVSPNPGTVPLVKVVPIPPNVKPNTTTIVVQPLVPIGKVDVVKIAPVERAPVIVQPNTPPPAPTVPITINAPPTLPPPPQFVPHPGFAKLENDLIRMHQAVEALAAQVKK